MLTRSVLDQRARLVHQSEREEASRETDLPVNTDSSCTVVIQTPEPPTQSAEARRWSYVNNHTEKTCAVAKLLLIKRNMNSHIPPAIENQEL